MSATAINRLMRDTDSRNSLAIAVIVMPHSRYAMRSASGRPAVRPSAFPQRAEQLALCFRNMARTALLGRRQRLHESDEFFVAAEHLLTQTGLPQRRFVFACVGDPCGALEAVSGQAVQQLS